MAIASWPKSFEAGVLGEGVRLVDEQHAAPGLLEEAGGLGAGVADVLADQGGAVGLDQVAALQKADGGQDAAVEPGDRGLARAGVAGEDEVAAERGRGQPHLLTAADHPHQLHQGRDVLFDAVQSGEAVEFGEQVLDGVLGGCLGLPRGRPRVPARPPAAARDRSAPVGRDGFPTSRERQSSNTGRAPFSSATSSSVSRTRQPRRTGAPPADTCSAGKAVPSPPAQAKTQSSKVPRAFSPTNRLFLPVRATVTDLTRGSAPGPTTRPEPHGVPDRAALDAGRGAFADHQARGAGPADPAVPQHRGRPGAAGDTGPLGVRDVALLQDHRPGRLGGDPGPAAHHGETAHPGLGRAVDPHPRQSAVRDATALDGEPGAVGGPDPVFRRRGDTARRERHP